MIGIILLTITAFILGFVIVFVDSKINVNDKLKESIIKCLPGYNCGACGYGSCEGMAQQIINDPNSYKKCRILKDKSELMKLLNDEKIKFND